MRRNFSVSDVRITGVISNYGFQRAKYLVLELHRSMPLCFPEPKIEGVLEMEWYRRLTEWRHVYGPGIFSLRRPVAVFLDGKLIGSDVELLKLTSMWNVLVECVPMKNSAFMKRKFRQDYLAHLKSSKEKDLPFRVISKIGDFGSGNQMPYQYLMRANHWIRCYSARLDHTDIIHLKYWILEETFAGRAEVLTVIKTLFGTVVKEFVFSPQDKGRGNKPRILLEALVLGNAVLGALQCRSIKPAELLQQITSKMKKKEAWQGHSDSWSLNFKEKRIENLKERRQATLIRQILLLNYCYLDICVDDNFVGTLVFQLYSNILPKTCENFTTLCLGTKGDFLSYKGTRIHRIVKNGWLQGGDNQYKTGGGGFSVYCSPLQDECYCISHDRRGILSMANNGKHTNGSQFFITLNPSTWMDTYFVAFGQLIQGVNVLNLIENIDTFREFPLQKIEIKNCGKLNLEDVDDVDARYTQDLRDAAPKKKPKPIEKIADQVARLVMEAVTEHLAVKERIPDVTHVEDVPSGVDISLYFQGFYSLPSEVLEQSAKYLRNLRRELFRHLRPSATEMVEVITYDLMGAVFTKYIDLDDVRETAEHSVYQRLIEGIDMRLEMIDKPYVKRFVDQLVTTAETTIKLASTKLNWMRRNQMKTRIFQDRMNEWIKSFVLQETFEEDSFRIAEKYSCAPPKKYSSENETSRTRTPTKANLEEHVCGCRETAKKEHKPMEICCKEKQSETDVKPSKSQYFNVCLYDLKRCKRENEGRAPVLDLIEISRYQLRILRNQEKHRRSSARTCLEKKIKQWMKDMAYTSETEWIRQAVFAEDDVCLNHTEEIMYGAMTVGLIEMYYLMEEYLKRPKRKRYRTTVIYPKGDDSLPDQGSIPGDEPATAESSCSDSQENGRELGSTSTKRREGERSQGVKPSRPCRCGDICCDCTSEPRNDEDLSVLDDQAVVDDQIVVPPTPPPSLEESVVSEEKTKILDYGEERSCTDIQDDIDIEQLLAQVTGKSADKINVKSFKWMQDYILEKSCQLKSEFAGQVHSWLDTHIFNYQGLLSKHSLVTRASLLSFPLSLASLLKEENNLKSELKDFIYDLWELYFKEMFKETLMEYPPKVESVEELKPESVKPETVLAEEEKEDEDVDEPCSKAKLLVKDDFDFDKFCRENAEINEEPQPVVSGKEDVPTATTLPPEDPIHDIDTGDGLKEEDKVKTPPCPIIIRELIKSSEEIRSSSHYATPFWVEFLGEITKRSLGLIAELSRLPRRLYFSSESQISFDDKIRSWIEFNNFSSCTTRGKDVRDFIAEHHVSVENLDETARSFLRKKIVWDSIEKSSRPTSSEILAEELVLELVMKAFETVEVGEGEKGKLSQEILQSLMRSATVFSAETPESELSSREDATTSDIDRSENGGDLANDLEEQR